MENKFVWNGEAVKSHLLAKADETKKAMAELIAERAYQYCPKDTGFLSNTIGVIESNLGDIYIVTVRAHYAYYVEFGHNQHLGGWVPGVYFMTRAIVDAAEAFPEIVMRTFVADTPTTSDSRWQLGATVE
ncbi:hypothetical protein V5E97_06730 [Singulisphaera sp. Ch08]|uniref:Uncharacterized protein n=1 Tax=Singulisphaera sp. Ch08 TaxID=3120278 RepID=A0AAU7CL24_9BACT